MPTSILNRRIRARRPGVPPVDPGSRSLLTASDFTYLGAFRPPYTAAGQDTSYSNGGFTHRYVSGSLRLMAISHAYTDGAVYEFAPATPTIPSDQNSLSSYPQASVSRTWGDVYGGKKVTSEYPSGDGHLEVNGLYWDAVASRLYWNYGKNYAAGASDPCFGFSTLDDGTGSIASYGPWRPAGVSPAKAKGGTLRIPAWFSSAYCPGKTIAVGCGGTYNTNAGDSLGPALFALAPPTPGVDAEGGTLVNTVGLDHPYNGTAGTSPYPARRAADYEGSVYGSVSGGSSTTVNLVYGTFYHAGEVNYAGRQITVYFADGTNQTRTVVSYAGSDVITVDAPFSGGKVPASGDHAKIPLGTAGAFTHPPAGGVGYWTFQDRLRQGWCWIDDAAGGRAKHGLLYFPFQGSGHMAYIPGGYQLEDGRYEMWVYDPASVAAVMGGSAASWSVDPVRSTLALPGLQSFAANPRSGTFVQGATFDATTGRLYLYVNSIRYDGSAWCPLIYVYQVAGA